jgi:hypothetical protein
LRPQTPSALATAPLPRVLDQAFRPAQPGPPAGQRRDQGPGHPHGRRQSAGGARRIHGEAGRGSSPAGGRASEHPSRRGSSTTCCCRAPVLAVWVHQAIILVGLIGSETLDGVPDSLKLRPDRLGQRTVRKWGADLLESGRSRGGPRCLFRSRGGGAPLGLLVGGIDLAGPVHLLDNRTELLRVLPARFHHGGGLLERNAGETNRLADLVPRLPARTSC